MHAICLVQGDYRQPWGRTDGSLNTGTWLRKRVSRAVGSRAHGHRPSWHHCRRLYWKNSPVFRLFPPTQEKKESMVYGVMGWQNFTHALVGDHEKKKTTGKQEREDAELPIVGTKSSGSTVAGSRAREAKHQEHWLYHGMGSQGD